MKTNIINIGHSKGVILPASILNELKLSLKSSVQIVAKNGSILITPTPRQGWEEAAIQMHSNNDDQLLSTDVLDNDNLEEWTWEEKK